MDDFSTKVCISLKQNLPFPTNHPKTPLFQYIFPIKASFTYLKGAATEQKGSNSDLLGSAEYLGDPVPDLSTG